MLKSKEASGKMKANCEPNSLVYIQASESYPKKQLVSDDPSLVIPFPELSGENTEYLGKCSGATLAISNFRFFALLQHAFVNIPFMLIENLEWKGKELPELFLWCKNGQSFQFKFDSSEECNRWYERLKKKCIASQDRLEDIFAFAFYAWSLDSPESPGSDTANLTCLTPRDNLHYDFLNEYRRMGFYTDCAWKITEVNSKFELCPSYPKLHIVPSYMTNEDLVKVAKFRTSRRFPSAVWRHRDNGAVIVRCSQPEVGWLYWRCYQDERFLQTLGTVEDASSRNTKHLTNGVETSNLTNCHKDLNGGVSNSPETNGISEHDETETANCDGGGKKVLVIDCRSYTAAFANRAKGGGSECTEYYPNCKIQFMCLANIHSVRKSFQSLRELCCKQEEQSGWLASLEATKWLLNISLLLKTALVVVKAVEQEKQHVVVHCSDGWDRTTQVVALAELLLDPHYRTIKGFRVLLEREWLAFGHKFADRCGHGCQGDDANERCPVFLQWLDCVHQLLRQFPCSFEFNETFLVKLAHHTYSCLFGTFLCNTEQERLETNIRHRTCSVWSLLDSQSRNFRNFLYSSVDIKVLYPEYQVRSLLLWSSLYLSTPVIVFDMSSTNASDTGLSGQHELSADHTHAHHEPRPSTLRRNSDGDVKSLISNSEEHFTSGTGFRDDSDLYLAKSLSCKSCTDTGKLVPGKGLVLNGASEGAHQTDERQDKVCRETLPDESDEEIFEDGGRHLGGELNDSMTSSSHTLVDDSNCLKNLRENGEDKYSDSSRNETDFTKTHTANGGLLYANGDCRGVKETQSKLSKTLNSHLNGVLLENDLLVNAVLRDHGENGGGDGGEYGDEHGGGHHGGDGDDLESSLDDPPYNKITKHLDTDGLTTVVDPVQSRLLELERSYRAQIDELQTQLQAQGSLCEPRAGLSSKQEMVSSLDPNFDGPKSLSSNATTDTCGSWEHVEEDDVTPTLWLPDHLAISCGGCDVVFTMANRKHHCRSCGKVFCSSCCDDMTPVPSEQHYDPVRVCKSCFEKLHVPKTAGHYGVCFVTA